MKKLTFITGLMIAYSVTSCSQDYEKLDTADIDEKKVKIAQDFATSYFTNLKNGTIYEFKDKAIEAIVTNQTPENQKAVYKQLKVKFGDFKSLAFSEVWCPVAAPSHHIIRFKSDFSESSKKLEIRVVVNESDKISGFWVKPWSDILL